MTGSINARSPTTSDQVETVEIWEKVDDEHMVAHVWVYDPPSLVEPWYVKQTYTKLDDEDRELRIRYWDCRENQNNDVIKTDTGSSQFRDFTFDKATPSPTRPSRSHHRRRRADRTMSAHAQHPEAGRSAVAAIP